MNIAREIEIMYESNPENAYGILIHHFEGAKQFKKADLYKKKYEGGFFSYQLS